MEGLTQYDSDSDGSNDCDAECASDKGPVDDGADIEMVVFNPGPAGPVEATVANVVPGPAERAAVRANAPVVNPFARMTNASKRRAEDLPTAPLREPVVAGNTEPPQPSLAEAAAAVAAASAVLADAEARAAAEDDTDSDAGTGPKMASIERTRVVAKKAETKEGSHRSGGGTRKSTEPKVTPHQRLQEYPNQGYKVLAGSLYCAGCKVNLSLIKSSITSHGLTARHAEKLAKLRLRSKKDDDLKVFLVEYFTLHNDYEGADVEASLKVDRYRVVEAMMDAGVALNIVDRLRPLLERGGASLTHSSHLRMFVPIIEAKEIDLVIAEMGELPWSLTIDATRRNGEALAGVSRWCDQDWVIHHRMVLFETTKKNCTGRELSSLVTVKVLTRLKKDPMSLVLFERDACAVNHAAFQILTTTFCGADDLLCFCHLGSLTGCAISFEELGRFMTAWLILVQNGAAAKALWISMTGHPMVGYSTIRWHSKGQVIIDIGNDFAHVPDFLIALVAAQIGDATTTTMMDAYTSDPLKLELQIAAIMDVKTIISITYEMEGERLEALLIYRRFEGLRALGRSIMDPAQARGVLRNVSALITRNATTLRVGAAFKKQFAGGGVDWFEGTITSIEDDDDGGKLIHVVYDDDDEEDLDEDEAMALLTAYGADLFKEIVGGITPAFAYLEARLTGTCQAVYSCVHSYEICELLQLFDPSFINENDITAEHVARLEVIVPYGARPALIEALQRDLHLYVAAAAGFTIDHGDVDDFTVGILTWWKNHATEVGAWAQAAQIAFAMAPNSAGAERVFSMLKTLFGSSQDSSLADFIRGSMMLHYNNTKRASEAPGN